MQILRLQAFFLGICAAALALVLQVFGVIFLPADFSSYTSFFLKIPTTALLIGVIAGALIEEIIRFFVLYGFWLRRDVRQDFPILGLLMGAGFALSEICLRIGSASHISEYIGLAGIFTLHCLLGLLLGALHARSFALGNRYFSAFFTVKTLTILFILHALYNACIILLIGPIVNGI